MADDRLYLDAVIQPSRSLSRHGLIMLLGVLVAVNVVVGAVFFLIGATPVPLFLGLDVIALFLAFWVSNRRGRSLERVQVSANEVRVIREGRRRAATVWISATAFTRVGLEERGSRGAEVCLALSGRRFTVGHVLGPVERAGLARSIEQAIMSARQERYE
jgi:uncharacterized membrane protein